MAPASALAIAEPYDDNEINDSSVIDNGLSMPSMVTTPFPMRELIGKPSSFATPSYPTSVADRVWRDIQTHKQLLRDAEAKRLIRPQQQSRVNYRVASTILISLIFACAVYSIMAIFIAGINYQEQDPAGAILWILFGLLSLSASFTLHATLNQIRRNARRRHKIFGGSRAKRWIHDNNYSKSAA